jgi:hypothetical protein
MMHRCLLAALALALLATDSDAGPLRRRGQPVYQPAYYQPVYQPSFQPSYQFYQPYTVNPSTAVPAGEYTSYYTPVVTASATSPSPEASSWAGDGLDEVNAKRAARGLRPFVRDDGLFHAARACASFRAERRLFGHTSNDFAFVPAGSSAASAGCAAYPASYGWMSCCVYENYTYAGAAWVTGADGQRYMHLFVR